MALSKTSNLRCGWLVIVFIVFLAPLFSNGAAQGEPFSPDFFPINPWGSHYVSGISTMAESNFTTGGFFVEPDHVPYVEAMGLNSILPSGLPRNYGDLMTWSDAAIEAQIESAVWETRNDPSVLGYFIIDEPGAIAFPKLSVAVQAVKTYAPGKLAYINLFPNYARPGDQLWTATYAEYLETYVQVVQPQILSYDNYKVLSSSPPFASYFTNLVQVRDVAIEHDLPFWNFVGSCNWGGLTVPSLENLSLQAYTSLAAGARGISWYRYYGGSVSNAPIDDPGLLNKTPTWYYLQEVNQQISTLAPTMLQLTSTGVYFTSPKPDGSCPDLPGSIIRDIHSDSPLPLMIGEFEHEDGEDYVMIVNLNLEGSAEFTIELENHYDEYTVSSADGAIYPYNISSPLSLGAGHGVLIKLVPVPDLLGDVNDDKIVGMGDLARIMANRDMTDAAWADGDLDGDGSVNWTDYAIVEANWGNVPPEPGEVPEPTTLLLLAGAGILMLLKRRRDRT